MSLEALNRRIKTTSDLGEIVSTMKMLSSVSVGQYEKALQSLRQYGQTIRDAFHGLFAQDSFHYDLPKSSSKASDVLGIIIGSDNGLVGRFNRDLMKFTEKYLQNQFPDSKPHIIAVGKRIGLLASSKPKYILEATYPISNSLKELAPISAQLLNKINKIASAHKIDFVYLFSNHKQGNAAFVARARQLIPFPEENMDQLQRTKWDGRSLPMISVDKDQLFRALLHEYLTVMVLHDLVSSLASEHYTRMIHMQEAEQNIEDSLDEFHLQYQQLRQAQITDELIDIVSGAEEMNKQKNQSPLDFSKKKK
ncbi:MAG: F0F1 ATP synthase subunit gamma [Alphaproteobacteria bacterium]|nr:F0F1 ATP synthase subunit gamma [Alphaproteobacteria bacterium]